MKRPFSLRDINHWRQKKVDGQAELFLHRDVKMTMTSEEFERRFVNENYTTITFKSQFS